MHDTQARTARAIEVQHAVQKARTGGYVLARQARLGHAAAVVVGFLVPDCLGEILEPGLSGKDIPAGARLLHCVLDFDRARSAGLSVVHALSRLGGNAGRYDPQVLEALTLRVVERTPSTEREVPVSELTTSMVVSRDVNTTDGSLLVCEGQQISESVKEHLANMLASGRLAETVFIRENPEDEAEDERAA